MSNYKYTSDGKKVVVLGSLNESSKIVQEVFIIDGKEIPSGENFIASVLHDAPAISWKERQIQRIESQYNEAVNGREKEMRELQKRHNNRVKSIKEQLGFLSQLNEKVDTSKVQLLVDLISGNLSHIVIDSGYGKIRVLEFTEAITRTEYGRFDSLKLLSVYGNTKGELDYRLNRYCDGSGSDDRVFPCNSKEMAAEVVKARILARAEAGRLTQEILDLADKYDYEIPALHLAKYNEARKVELQKRLENLKSDIDKKVDESEMIKKQLIKK